MTTEYEKGYEDGVADSFSIINKQDKELAELRDQVNALIRRLETAEADRFDQHLRYH